ncbi:MAG TPA: YifB family Mg chelatase-like AAA ATPase [Burkholderiaceae bacterium]|nr:YifB family Mg chelatase-like AAA ATPase [Burkholderiaceae bacterium]
MSLAVVRSRALDGMDAPPVQVEVHLANGLPSFTLVGLADTEVKEARERVRAALAQSGLAFPSNKRITVNLAPADLPKESGRFDLPIALGILAADGQLDAEKLDAFEFAGELSLAGELRPVRGALALALAMGQEAARTAGGARTLVLPAASAAEAALADRVRVARAAHLLDVVAALQPGDAAPPLAAAVAAAAPAVPPGAPDLADVRGQVAAKRALEIAAAGNHSLLMVGPPGAGKSMLAQRLVGLLPPMGHAEALASASIASVAGAFDIARWQQRPYRAPHHSATPAALVGGGAPPRPGEISLAYGGVLFLDEMPEWPRAALEALREPMEAGRITIARAVRRATFPARFQLVGAMNPCPCGWLGAPAASGHACRCTPDAVARYQGKLSGPLLDRIDLQVEVPAVKPDELIGAPDGEPSAAVAARVAAARELQWARQGRPNADLAGAALDAHCELDAESRSLLMRAAERLGWSGRSLHRVLRVARSVADLAGSDRIRAPHLAEAMQWRRALPAAGA